tara:strand:- start:187 stop:540 length:354 start_codon:yes stop_codon:yes gene_type:complete
MMPRKKWTQDQPHRLRVKTPKWLPIVNDMAFILSQVDSPQSTAALYDMWWDWDVERRATKTAADGFAGIRNKSPYNAPTRRELSMWLKRDGRFYNVNEGPRSSGKTAMWVYQTPRDA